MDIAVPNRVVEARSASTTEASSSQSTCGPNDTTGRCERGTSSSTFTLPIVLGVAIPVIAFSILFFFLHRRHVRKQREEDANDRHASLDFGLGNVPQPGRPKKPPGSQPETYGEKPGRPRQLSMDMAINSPYILPPQLNGSHESLRSMSRSMHENEDPYRPVTQYYGDSSSIKSGKFGRDGSSVYTGSSKAPSRLHEFNPSTNLLSNASGMAQSTPPTSVFVPPPRQGSLPQKSAVGESIAPAFESAPTSPPPPPYPVEPAQAHLSESTATRNALPANALPASPRPGQNLSPAVNNNSRDSSASNADTGLRLSNNYLGAFINARDSSPSPQTASGTTSQTTTANSARSSPPPNSLPSNPRPARKESLNTVQPEVAQTESKTFMDDESDYGNGFQVTPPSPKENKAEILRGQRYSMDVPPEEFAQAGLGAPGFDPRRLSMGFRPLPPDTALETEDPETRANRIRSFYKEYFDESKPAPQGQYYEDYDENYLGDSAAYFDPSQNSFVMPYAQPVTRRAMTPPPRGGPRFQGQGQQRGRQGSMGAMSTGGMSAGGMRRPMYPPGPYPQGPKAFSTASGGRGPKRPMPPPAALNTIPTPSKLRDDSFAIFNAMDFAPPPTYRDRAAGRSESPLGERRPYSPAVPAFTPTVSAFDELAPMPSPHLLRKSGTFTALDFAPPKKFRDPDSMSDAGSIRSNRSGVSARHLGAIRNGAYRVSRLPQDIVATKDDMTVNLKPQWGMRPEG
ncbi:hypothetical protein B0O99DRAFT_649907 [Bisporella sp. PMI_857]|nr:hypothetical protein B0O99DRAFT_649907 [Bisporella sp. PMI_857]